MTEKYSKEEFFKKLNKNERNTIGEKAFLLANGMIDVHGFHREKALKEALRIAADWYENDRRYIKRRL